MNTRLVSVLSITLVGAAGASIALTAGSPAVAAAAAPAAADAYSVDSVHSAVVFRIKHNNVAYFYGRFNNPTGSFHIDPAKPEAGVLEVSVKAADVDTANGKRDDHLRSADFFSAKEYPTISFKGKSFKKAGDNAVEVSGDLTLHGVTKPVTVKVDLTGTGEARGGAVAGIETTFTIKRSDFGMNFMQGPLGDEITLMIGLEGGKK